MYLLVVLVVMVPSCSGFAPPFLLSKHHHPTRQSGPLVGSGMCMSYPTTIINQSRLWTQILVDKVLPTMCRQSTPVCFFMLVKNYEQRHRLLPTTSLGMECTNHQLKPEYFFDNRLATFVFCHRSLRSQLRLGRPLTPQAGHVKRLPSHSVRRRLPRQSTSLQPRRHDCGEFGHLSQEIQCGEEGTDARSAGGLSGSSRSE